MTSPTDLRYTESHEWFKVEDDQLVTVGITRYAVDELTDVTYVEMRPPGTAIESNQVVGEVESVKTTSDIFSVVAGEVVEVNEALNDDPSLVNSDPYGAGWLVKIKATDTSPLDGLMDQATYDQKHPVS